ncbi:MAG TPA: radical SAM/SPASM domain-containing protein [Thermoanaerobaculia bacterium]|nr:radical SAM/SPASM domain-containing protein [Thermoanaerobaculia bacterium]
MPDATLSAAIDPQVDDSVASLFGAEARRIFASRLQRLAEGPLEEGGAELEFPVELAIELAAVCNLACVMCPVPTTRRPKQLMDDDLFRRLVDQATGERGFLLLPQGFGESMLHKRWAELLAYAVERGVRPIVLLTNGTLLDERNVARVIALDVDAVVVSIDGVTPATYASVRVGGDLDEVEAGVRRLLEARGERSRPKVCLRIIRMRETDGEIDAFFARWSPLLRPDDELRINEYNDWAGKVADHSAPGHEPAAVAPGRGPCRMLWRNLSVHADGKVSACCHDSEDELIVGDVAAGETLQQIWRGPALRRLRRLHLEGRIDELPICQACRNWY